MGVDASSSQVNMKTSLLHLAHFAQVRLAADVELTVSPGPGMCQEHAFLLDTKCSGDTLALFKLGQFSYGFSAEGM